LAASNLLDYDDLLLRCADLLRNHPQCVSNVQAVLVDEFQDTNRIQFELMNLLASRQRCITIVGDPDQSIYGFRSAEIKNLERMQRLYSNASVVLLEDNYRSSGSILGSAEEVIQQDTSRPVKKLLPTHGVGTMPVLRKLPSAAAEAQWMVTEIKRCIALTGSLLKPSDFAVLLRSASLSRQIESEMGKQGVPYRMVGGSRFFDRVEIRLLLDYLRVVSHPENNDALIRIINTPARKMGEETIKTLTTGAEKDKLPLWNYVKDVAQGRRSTQKNLSKAADVGLSGFVGLIESARRKLEECADASSPKILLEFIIKKLGFREYLGVTYPLDEENRWANVEELLAQAGDPSVEASQDDALADIDGLEQQQGHAGEEALSRFLANVALSTEVKTEENQAEEKVTISTIHAAKGLEWPVVFVAAVYEGIIPHSRAEDSDEERRLLYVAMTRAQALLYLSLPRRDSKNGEETKPSSFLPRAITETKFRQVGPKLHDQIIFDIAEILRRPRPSQDAMVEGLKGLPSIYDDMWNPDGDDDGPNKATRWDGTEAGQESWAKRRRLNGEGGTVGGFVGSSAYTMSNSSHFSVSTSTLSVGFSTARQQMEMTPNTAPKDTVSKEDTAPKEKQKRETATSSRTASTATQGTLSRYFGVTEPTSQNKTSLPSIPNKQQHFLQSKPPLSPPVQVPPSLGGHRIQPQQFRRPAPANSSTNYTWLSEASTGTVASTKKDAATATETTTTTAVNEIKRPVDNNCGVRPAATFHTTSMSTLQQQPGPRKTLGIRRSVHNGWAERMNRGS
jgi:DNA helicase-2/ATP-dependent DNA helicase PcrA